jgi:uracil-DNA glycosylase
MTGMRSSNGGVELETLPTAAQLRRELGEIAAGLRVHAEQLAATGATGVPRSPRAPRRRPESTHDTIAPPSSAPPSSGRTSPSTSSGRGSAATSSGAVSTPPSSGRNSTPPSSRGSTPPSSGPTPRITPADIAAVHLVSLCVPDAPDLRQKRLVELCSEIRSCDKCSLSRRRNQTVFARGNPQAELCFVGEGPGADEDEQGEPFVGKAGQLLDKMISAMGFARDEVYICNIVKCRPPENRKPEPAEMLACAPYLAEQLRLVSPKVIVALGATAVEGLLGADGITRLRGQWRLYRGTVPTMPTFHPSYLLRNPAAKREVWSDLQAVLKQLGRSVPQARPTPAP